MSVFNKEDLKKAFIFIEALVQGHLRINPYVGLCSQPRFRDSEDRPQKRPSTSTQDVVKFYIRQWAEEHDLDPKYPIEGSRELYLRVINKWDDSTTFGQRRHSMLEAIFEKIEQDLEAEELLLKPANVAEEALAFLKRIKDSGNPVSPDAGLCSQYLISTEYVTTAANNAIDSCIDNYIEVWSITNKRDLDYPIEGSGRVYIDNENKWDKSTNFGADRWRLLDDVIEMLEEDVWLAKIALEKLNG